MKLSHSFRVVTALVMLFSMLFMQYAVASYACPGMKIGQDSAPAAMQMDAGNKTMSGMSGCEGIDAKQPNLCHAHDQVGNQSLDKPEVPHVQPFMAAALMLAFQSVEIGSDSIAAPPDSPLLTRTTAPPLSIRNCCFRL